MRIIFSKEDVIHCKRLLLILIIYVVHMVTSYDGIKIRRVINKGTKIIEEEYKQPNWVGGQLYDHETKKISLAGDIMTSIAKGTNKARLHTVNRTRPTTPKGIMISINKGTSRVRL